MGQTSVPPPDSPGGPSGNCRAPPWPPLRLSSTGLLLLESERLTGSLEVESLVWLMAAPDVA